MGTSNAVRRNVQRKPTKGLSSSTASAKPVNAGHAAANPMGASTSPVSTQETGANRKSKDAAMSSTNRTKQRRSGGLTLLLYQRTLHPELFKILASEQVSRRAYDA